MTDPGSPIIDFYPTNYELDLNGKKNDWEAIVKIPFIDENRLLEALNGIAISLLMFSKREAINSRRTGKKLSGLRVMVYAGRISLL